jgi:hypothetical protein
MPGKEEIRNEIVMGLAAVAAVLIVAALVIAIVASFM